jgi:hypothetical protein
MKLLNMLVPALGILGWASAADAGTILKTTGTITGMDAFLAGAPTAVPTGSIAIGDKFTLTAKFDLSAAQIDPLYDANPALNIYYMPGTQISLQIGSWTRTFTASSPNSAQIQLNDGPASDAQSFWLYDYNAASNLPVDMGAGFVIDGIFDFNRDPTGTARSNDLITQLVPLSAFSDRTLSVGFFNYNTLYMVGFHGQVEESSLITTPAPETASWMMMLAGFGLIGAAKRYRRNTKASFT